MPDDELVDIVDNEDHIVATVTRAAMRDALASHRATYVFVLSGDGQRLLAHQRAATKDVWPSRWDLAAGGVVGSGESYDDAAARELAEEVGIDTPIVEIGTTTWQMPAPGGVIHGRAYVTSHDGPFTFTDGEVERVEWIALDDLDTELEQRTWCDDTIEAVLPVLWSHILGGPQSSP